MLGWLSEPAMRDSRTKRSAKAGSARMKRRQFLQGDDAIEVGLPGEIDDCHPAAADLTDDVVSPERTQDLGHRTLPRGYSDVFFKRTIGKGVCR